MKEKIPFESTGMLAPASAAGLPKRHGLRMVAK